jgi:phosphomannomutase
MHGVGGDLAVQALRECGFHNVAVVGLQHSPDPDFPTAAFPNPEEPGASDLLLALAADIDADIAIALDPDADRCAVAVPDDRAASGWRMLRGDEVGALLAARLVAGKARGTFATTIVSSSLLGRIAAAAGLPYAQTLTGFKWLSRVDGLRYGYEEALGYCVDPDGVRDKDGITAALLVAELTAELKREGRTLTDLLDDLAVEHGLHATDQLSVRVADLSLIARAMDRLRETPPSELAGMPVTSADDLSRGSDTLPPTDGLRYRVGDDAARVVVRPSGTEPKLKCYLEAVVPVADAAALPAAHAEARRVLDALRRDIAQAAGI